MRAPAGTDGREIPQCDGPPWSGLDGYGVPHGLADHGPPWSGLDGYGVRHGLAEHGLPLSGLDGYGVRHGLADLGLRDAQSGFDACRCLRAALTET